MSEIVSVVFDESNYKIRYSLLIIVHETCYGCNLIFDLIDIA